MEFSLNKTTNKSKNNHFQAAIIGSGPAGLTAAIYLGRSKVETVVFEKITPGGYIINVEKIENYPGFAEGISGQELAKLYVKHAEHFGAIIKNEEVSKLEFNKSPFVIETSQGSYTADSLIMASGSSSKKIGVPGEEKFIHKGISFCAACDAPFFEGENVVVVGAGNSGTQEALYISKFAKHIIIVEFLDHPTCEPILLDRINKNDKIELLTSHAVVGFKGDKFLESVEIKDINSGEIKSINAKGSFIYAGEEPNSNLVKDKLELDKNGYILTDKHLKTSVKGVFAAGNVRDTTFRQVATAIGDGAVAAHETYKFLEEAR